MSVTRKARKRPPEAQPLGPQLRKFLVRHMSIRLKARLKKAKPGSLEQFVARGLPL